MKGLLIISALGLLAMLAEIFKVKKLILPITLLGIVIALIGNYFEWNSSYNLLYFDNMIAFDKPAIAFSGIILLTAFFWFIMAKDYFIEYTEVSFQEELEKGGYSIESLEVKFGEIWAIIK
jgi:NADH-quinone oxidoreductase subunit N